MGAAVRRATVRKFMGCVGQAAVEQGGWNDCKMVIRVRWQWVTNAMRVGCRGLYIGLRGLYQWARL
jgi:hypothetical protein